MGRRGFLGMLAALTALGCAHVHQLPAVGRPTSSLHASPRVAFAPAQVLFRLQLRGGEDLEDYHCPAVGWSFGDGSISASEADCEPWFPGAAIERTYMQRHVYKRGGDYVASVGLWKRGLRVAHEEIALSVRSGLGE